MASSTTFDAGTQDFKLDSDRKREVDHRRKYALGIVEGGPTHKDKPATPLGQRTRQNFRVRQQKVHGATSAAIKQLGKHPNLNFDTSDSSADEDVREASAAPEPDAGITYSFDAPRGPAHGSEILSMAINKAVERFEVKMTEKLVKDEYEVVTRDVDNGNDGGYMADEDDFEIV